MDIQKQIEEARRWIEPLKMHRWEETAECMGNLISALSQQSADIERLLDGMRRISECGDTEEDAREMRWIAREFI